METEGKVESKNTFSLRDVVNETTKPILLPVVGMDGGVPYIRPSQKEIDKILEDVEKVVEEKAKIIREKDRLNCYDSTGKRIPNSVLVADKKIEQLEAQTRADFMLFAGLKKADKNVTKEVFEQLSPDVKSAMSLYLTKVSYKGILSDEDVHDVKNLQALTKD